MMHGPGAPRAGPPGSGGMIAPLPPQAMGMGGGGAQAPAGIMLPPGMQPQPAGQQMRPLHNPPLPPGPPPPHVMRPAMNPMAQSQTAQPPPVMQTWSPAQQPQQPPPSQQPQQQQSVRPNMYGGAPAGAPGPAPGNGMNGGPQHRMAGPALFGMPQQSAAQSLMPPGNAPPAVGLQPPLPSMPPPSSQQRVYVTPGVPVPPNGVPPPGGVAGAPSSSSLLAARAAAWQAKAAQEDAEAPHLAAMFPFLYSGPGGGGHAAGLAANGMVDTASAFGGGDTSRGAGNNGALRVGLSAPGPASWGPPSVGGGHGNGLASPTAASIGGFGPSLMSSASAAAQPPSGFERDPLGPPAPWLTHGAPGGAGGAHDSGAGRLFGSSRLSQSAVGMQPNMGSVGGPAGPGSQQPPAADGAADGSGRSKGVLPALRALRA